MTATPIPPVVVTVTPNPGLDLTYTLPGIPPTDDDVLRASVTTLEASGKGVNVSRALAAAGVRTDAVLPVGGATGHQLVELLADEGVPHRVVEQTGQTRINTSVLRPDGVTLKVNGPGAALTACERQRLVSATVETVEGACSTGPVWLAICGSLPPGCGPDLVTELVQVAHALGIRCAVDASGDALAAALAAGADLLAPNLGELDEVRVLDVGDGSIEASARAVQDVSRATGAALLVSLGADGAFYADGDLLLHGWAPPLIPMNTAGAGDALFAGWLSCPADVDPAVRLATAMTWGRSACLAPTTLDATPGARDDAQIQVNLVGDGPAHPATGGHP